MSSLRSAFNSPADKRCYVRHLFATIAGRYDLITPLLSYGRDRHWKARLIDFALRGTQGRLAGGNITALDLACGTGDIAHGLAARGARVTGLDLVPSMVTLARAKNVDGTRLRPPRFVIGDMMGLPFPAASFDLVTTGYGLRNTPILENTLAEIFRVLRPGGHLFSLDFDRPVNPFVRGVYLTYLTLVGSLLGLALHGDADTYRYIAMSLQRYPGASAVTGRMKAVGFSDAGYLPLFGGLMAINNARK